MRNMGGLDCCSHYKNFVYFGQQVQQSLAQQWLFISFPTPPGKLAQIACGLSDVATWRCI